MVGFVGTLPVYLQLPIYQYPRVFFIRAALNPFIPQSVPILVTTLTQLQDLALDFAELHEIYIGLPLKPVKATLNGTFLLEYQLHHSVWRKFAESVPNPAVLLITILNS